MDDSGEVWVLRFEVNSEDEEAEANIEAEAEAEGTTDQLLARGRRRSNWTQRRCRPERH